MQIWMGEGGGLGGVAACRRSETDSCERGSGETQGGCLDLREQVSTTHRWSDPEKEEERRSSGGKMGFE